MRPASREVAVKRSPVVVDSRRRKAACTASRVPRVGLRAAAFVLIGVGWLCSASPALAADFSFRGSFSADDDVQRVSFVTDGTSAVVLRTHGYGGGTQADGTVISAGGFDPVLEVFDAAGARVDGNDDGSDADVSSDPLTDSGFDAYLAVTLGAGSYTVAVVQYDNHALGPTLVDGFAKTGSQTFTSAYGCGTGEFCDQSGNVRTRFWAFDILGAQAAALSGCPGSGSSSPTDSDGDGVPDACDNCTRVSNPRVSATWLAANPWAVLTGGQRDDDADGFGNKCDAKFPNISGALVATADLAAFRTAHGKSRERSDCGVAHSRSCAIFDLDEGTGRLISTGDIARFRALNGSAPGPKCSTCPLVCEAGALRTCEP